MVTEYTTTHRNTAIWWIVGAIVVLALIWIIFRDTGNNGAGIPNTGVDTAATSTLDNSNYLTPNPAAKG